LGANGVPVGATEQAVVVCVGDPGPDGVHGQQGQRPVDRLRGGVHGAERTRRVAFRGSCTTQTDERAEPRGAQEERSTHSPPLSSSKISSIRIPKRRAMRNASGRLGSNFPVSMAFTV